jgi:acetyl-CoA carboxylase biotin carboxyl carrier protein
MAEQTPQELVETVRRAAADLMERRADAPHTVRVRATEVAVEMTWDGAAVRSVPAQEGRTEAAAPATPATAATAATTVTAATPAAADAARRYLRSPSVGTFYRSPEPGSPPFVDVGSVVTPGQQIGIVEVMKLMIPVEADGGGRVVEILKADAEPVEYGETLVAVVDSAGS